MAESIYVTIGIDTGEFEKNNVGKTVKWPVKKGVHKGNRVFFLIGRQFKAEGRVASDKETRRAWGKSPKIFRRVSDIRMLDVETPLDAVCEAIPGWRWCRSKTPIQTSVPAAFVDAFLNLISKPPVPSDLDDGPQSSESVVRRFIRDSVMARKMKAKYSFRCHVASCSFSLRMPNGTPYIEAHYLMPLHKAGPDKSSNILLLCPNHHALFDYRVPVFESSDRIRIGDKVENLRKHELAHKYIAFHNGLATGNDV